MGSSEHTAYPLKDFQPLIVKSGEIASQEVVFEASIPPINPNEEKKEMIIACLHIEFFTGDNEFHVSQIPVVPVSLHYKDGTVTAYDSMYGYFLGTTSAIDLLIP